MCSGDRNRVFFHQPVQRHPRHTEIEGGTVISTTELTVTATINGSAVALTIHPTLIAVYRNRMLYAGDPVYPNFLFFSNTDLPLTITAEAVIRVGRGDGGRITAIAVAGTTGGDAPAESQFVILKDRQPWLFRGDLPTAGVNAGQADLHLLPRAAGCVNHRTLVVTPQGIMWAGYDDVYLMPSVGALPVSVGYKVGPLLKSVQPVFRARMRAVYYDGFYRLLLLRGPLQESRQIWADVRTPKITWWGPMVGGLWSDFYPDHRPGYESRLLASSSSDVTHGRLYALDSGQHFEQAEDDISASGIIMPVLQTKEYDLGDANLRKLIEGAEVNFYNDRTRNVTVTFLGDPNRTVEVTFQAAGVVLGNTLPSGAFSARHSPLKFSAQSVGRTVSRTIKLKIEASSLGAETDVGPFYIQEIALLARTIRRRPA